MYNTSRVTDSSGVAERRTCVETGLEEAVRSGRRRPARLGKGGMGGTGDEPSGAAHVVEGELAVEEEVKVGHRAAQQLPQLHLLRHRGALRRAEAV